MANGALNRNIFGLAVTTAAAAVSSQDKEAVEGRAVIAYQSILDSYDVSIAASSAASGFAATNVKSRLTFSGWQPSAGGAQTLTFSAYKGKTVDYLGIAAHNLSSMAATIDLQWSDDGATGWTSMLSGGYAPVSDAPILLLVTSQSKKFFRLVVNVSGSAYPTLGVVMLGPRLQLARGIYVGHRPATFQRNTVFNTNDSEGGQILGRSVVRRMNDTQAALRNFTPAWWRSYGVPFQISAETLPFFFLWNTDSRYSREAIFGELTAPLQPYNEKKNFMAVDLSIHGLA